jgi:hypothetical protein
MPKRERFAVKLVPPPTRAEISRRVYESGVPIVKKRKAKKRGKPRHDPAYGTPEIPSFLSEHLRKKGDG